MSEKSTSENINLQIEIEARLEQIRSMFKPEFRKDYKFTFVGRYAGTAKGDYDLIVSNDSMEEVSKVVLRRDWPQN